MSSPDEMFPVLGAKSREAAPGTPTSVPWSMLAPHERQARINHGQTLRRLAERGGLSPCEMIAVLEDRPWRRMDKTAAVFRLAKLVEELANAPAATEGERADG